MANSPDYATYIGLKSLAGAIVFAIVYFPLFAFYFARAISRPTYVFIILSLFCAIRFVSFVLRASLINIPSDGNNLNLIIAYEILYNIGFFGILYSAYTLVADRAVFVQNPPNNPIFRLLRIRFLFRIALTAAVALGITGAINSTLGTGSTATTGNTLREVAIYIFFVCSVFVLFYSLLLAYLEFSEGGYRGPGEKIGATHGIYILLLIAILLVAREAFFTATAKKSSEQDNEKLWYPLAALTELIAVILFTAPGLVPARSELPKETSFA